MSARENAIDTIRQEHHSLGVVLHTLQELLNKVAANHAVADFGLFAAALYYIDDFPERCHHPKEENHLFKAMRLRSAESADVLDRLQSEHARGAVSLTNLHRALVHYQGGAPEGLSMFRAAVDGYVADMREHMACEDALMKRAQVLLTDDDWRQIASAFAANDDPLFGHNQRLEFTRLYQRIMVLAPRKMKTALRAGKSPPYPPL